MILRNRWGSSSSSRLASLSSEGPRENLSSTPPPSARVGERGERGGVQVGSVSDKRYNFL